MASADSAEIERQFGLLPLDEQLWLLERLVRGLRQHVPGKQAGLDQDLAAMAADPEIQRELRAIEEEFSAAEGDGLEDL